MINWCMMDRLDLYLPPESDKPKPVVIFVTGGAWIIGYVWISYHSEPS
jgi:acetyl esterase/lipase